MFESLRAYIAAIPGKSIRGPGRVLPNTVTMAPHDRNIPYAVSAIVGTIGFFKVYLKTGQQTKY